MNIFLRILFLLIAVNGFALQQRQRCKLSHGITDFEEMRDKNYCYIDKTGFILKLLESKLVFFYFIARPRKFGKSLFCRTIESALWGNKKFFEGLAIHDSHDWTPHPVIYLDFSSLGLESQNYEAYANEVVKALQKIPKRILENHRDKIRNPEVRIHADTENTRSIQRSLGNLVTSLGEAFSSEVGIVIDEYDSFMTRNLKNPELVSNIYKHVLEPFYSKIKSLETELRFVFVTGVTTSIFQQSHLFSSMINLIDISEYEDYSNVLGFTVDEMKYFAPEIEAVVKYRKEKGEENVTIESQNNEMGEHYDGYKFTAAGPFLFHPSFLITYLDTKDHNMVGVKNPEPKFLFDIIPTRLYSPSMLTGINVTANDLGGIIDPENLKLAPLLFSTGIFSIKKYDRFSNTYFLHYPNKFIAKYFEDKVFKKLMEPLGIEQDYESFADRCKKMMTNLLVGDENHLRTYFDQLNILAIQRPNVTYPQKPREQKDPIKMNSQDHFLDMEDSFQDMTALCLDCSKFGRVYYGPPGNIAFKILTGAKTILYETKAGVGNVIDGLNQVLKLDTSAFLDKKETIVCISVSFSKTTRLLEDWIYVEYDDKGTLLKIFAHDNHNVEKLKLKLYDISITHRS